MHRISENSGTSMTADEHADAGGADEQAEQRGDDRQAHGDDRAERDEQHDDGDADADELAARLLLRRAGRAHR